ncbi:MAG: SURF1 family protein, partial [Gammaproteobacteria bacterium]|nr:SURF1 family protein [Gammaproteobacteria bacterium]
MVVSRNWIVFGGLLLAAAGFVSLGRWQLDRAEVNRSLAARFAAGIDAAPLTVPLAEIESEMLRYERLSLRGRYEPAMQILLDNRTRDGVAGYEVLTPFRVEDAGPLVLVNRGFVPAALDRSVLPDVALGGPFDTVVDG